MSMWNAVFLDKEVVLRFKSPDDSQSISLVSRAASSVRPTFFQVGFHKSPKTFRIEFLIHHGVLYAYLLPCPAICSKAGIWCSYLVFSMMTRKGYCHQLLKFKLIQAAYICIGFWSFRFQTFLIMVALRNQRVFWFPGEQNSYFLNLKNTLSHRLTPGHSKELYNYQMWLCTGSEGLHPGLTCFCVSLLNNCISCVLYFDLRVLYCDLRALLYMEQFCDLVVK